MDVDTKIGRDPRATMLTVADAVRVSLPTELANDLVEEGVAVRPLLTRAGVVGEVIDLALSGMDTGANVVTLVTAGVAMRRLVQRVRARRGRDDRQGDSIEIELSGPVGTKRVVLAAGVPVDAAAEELLAALAWAAGPKETKPG